MNRKMPLPACARTLGLRLAVSVAISLESAHRIGLADRQRHHHPPWLVAQSLRWFLVVQ